MKKFYIITLSCIAASALTGCVKQSDADAKMVKGCQTAISTMIAPAATIKGFRSSSAEPEKTMGSVYRRIKITYIENEDFAESEKQGSCLFSEEWGLFRSSHAALLEQVAYNDTFIGKKDGIISGDMNAFLKLTESADTAMGQQ